MSVVPPVVLFSILAFFIVLQASNQNQSQDYITQTEQFLNTYKLEILFWEIRKGTGSQKIIGGKPTGEIPAFPGTPTNLKASESMETQEQKITAL